MSLLKVTSSMVRVEASYQDPGSTLITKEQHLRVDNKLSGQQAPGRRGEGSIN